MATAPLRSCVCAVRAVASSFRPVILLPRGLCQTRALQQVPAAFSAAGLAQARLRGWSISHAMIIYGRCHRARREAYGVMCVVKKGNRLIVSCCLMREDLMPYPVWIRIRLRLWGWPLVLPRTAGLAPAAAFAVAFCRSMHSRIVVPACSKEPFLIGMCSISAASDSMPIWA